MIFSADRETFAAQRRDSQDEAIEALIPVVQDALANWGEPDWFSPIVDAARVVWTQTQTAEGEATPPTLTFSGAVARSLMETGDPSRSSEGQAQRIAAWVAVYAINASTEALIDAQVGQFVLKEWVTMQDPAVRDLHVPLQGVQRPLGSTFDVGGTELQFPGQPIGPLEAWYQCRCVIRPVTGEEMTDAFAPTVVAETDTEAESAGEPVTISGVLVPMNERAGDGRKIVAATWAQPPLPLRWIRSDMGRHDGAVRVGDITNVYEADGEIRFDGILFAGVPESTEVENLLSQTRMGLSIDGDQATTRLAEGVDLDDDDLMGMPDTDNELRIRGATILDIGAFTGSYATIEGSPSDFVLTASAGNIVDFAISEAEWDGDASRFSIEEWRRSTVVDTGEGDEDSKSRYKVPILEPDGDLNRNAVHNAAARINQVDAPPAAVASGKAKLRAAYRRLDEEPPEVLTASAFTIYEETTVLPSAWFEDPSLPCKTPVTVTQDGRVFGHIAVWDQEHVGLGMPVGQDGKTYAPKSAHNYAYFRTGVVDTEGGEVAIGTLVMDTGHANGQASARATMAHYDNTGTAVADVVCGEDGHGIWFSGAMRDGLDEQQVRAFKASSLSGDWRWLDGGYELVAALAVNTPGFPIPRVAVAASGSRPVSLVAAGIVTRDEPGVDVDKIAQHAATLAVEAIDRRQRVADVRARYRSMVRQEMAARLS